MASKVSEKSATHTPGPWNVFEEDGEIVVAQKRDGGWTSGIVCTVCDEFDAEDIAEFQRGNARLIAAAPDLLLALKSLDELESGNSEDVLGGIAGSAVREFKRIYRAAIAKAEGR